MTLEAIDLFYFALPQIRDVADGSQDSFIVRIRSDEGLEGFGESDSAPLLALAGYCTPSSHSNIVNLSQSLIGQRLDSVADVRRIFRHAHAPCPGPGAVSPCVRGRGDRAGLQRPAGR